VRPENDTLRRKRDREFQSRVLDTLEKPKENRFWALLNSSFLLWVLSLALLSFGGTYYSSYRQCRQDAYTQIEQYVKLQSEYYDRIAHLRSVVRDSPTVESAREQLKQPYFHYREFKDASLSTVQEAYNLLSRHIQGFHELIEWPPSSVNPREAKVFLNADGTLPSTATEQDLAELKKGGGVPDEYVLYRKLFPFLSPSGYYGPACGPKNIARIMLGWRADVVRQITAKYFGTLFD
jgi:hypothetical protein